MLEILMPLLVISSSRCVSKLVRASSPDDKQTNRINNPDPRKTKNKIWDIPVGYCDRDQIQSLIEYLFILFKSNVYIRISPSCCRSARCPSASRYLLSE